jgi:hypothetical protein
MFKLRCRVKAGVNWVMEFVMKHSKGVESGKSLGTFGETERRLMPHCFKEGHGRG